MVNSLNSSIFLPFTLFETVARFDDYSADDMQCGDMGEEELLALGLRDISAKVDPYRLVLYDFPLNTPVDNEFSFPQSGRKISHQECVNILFTKMKELATMFSLYGKYKIVRSVLPKFNGKEDKINGFGITVHDISALAIKLFSLNKYAIGWDATLFFDAQDRFGLDVIDIQNKLYRQFRFFRIWFFLQRHRDFAFKPFFTNFHTVIRIGK
ncbi:DUF3289 family protein [Enterobacter bugandensis]